MTTSLPAARRKARRALLQALYQWQLSHASAHEIEVYFVAHQSEKMAKVDRPYFSKLLNGIVSGYAELDAALEPLLDRKVTELTPVEHAILYIGCYELMHQIDLPYKIVINEGIELGKAFGAEDSYKYINGVLDKLSYKLRRAERLPKS